MRAKHVFAFAAAFVVSAAMSGQATTEAKPKPVAKAGGMKAVVMPESDEKWMDLGDSPGVQIVDLWGDHTKGAFGALIKFPPGMSAPMHTHTATMKIVVISGTVIHGPEGKDEVRLGAGSYLMQPGRTYRHTTKCDEASPCELFIESTGKFDLKPVDGGAAKK